MGREIERKFLVRGDGWRQAMAAAGAPERFRQFYLALREGFSVRLRIVDEVRALLTLKSGAGLARDEFEYPVPLADAHALEASHLGTVIEKRRFRIPHGRHTIELDVFDGALAPLVLAEVELSAENERFEPPDWFGADVTEAGHYTNAALARDGLPKDFSA